MYKTMGTLIYISILFFDGASSLVGGCRIREMCIYINES